MNSADRQTGKLSCSLFGESSVISFLSLTAAVLHFSEYKVLLRGNWNSLIKFFFLASYLGNGEKARGFDHLYTIVENFRKT